jgi:DNA-binding CsgD family transcriptional regulator
MTPHNKDKSIITDKQLEIVMRMRSERKTYKETAVVVGCRWNYVYKLIKRYNDMENQK